MAGFLETLQLVEGAVESALQAGLVAGEVLHDVVPGHIEAQDPGDALGGVRAGRLVVVFGVAVDAIGDVGGLQGAAAAEPPGGLDEVAGEERFQGAEGRQGLPKLAGVKVEGGGVFGGDHGLAGSEPVFESVAAGAGLALRGFGAGGALGVVAVGLDLTVGGHSEPHLSAATRQISEGGEGRGRKERASGWRGWGKEGGGECDWHGG
jgi:hypothetical protein